MDFTPPSILSSPNASMSRASGRRRSSGAGALKAKNTKSPAAEYNRRKIRETIDAKELAELVNNSFDPEFDPSGKQIVDMDKNESASFASVDDSENLPPSALNQSAGSTSAGPVYFKERRQTADPDDFAAILRDLADDNDNNNNSNFTADESRRSAAFDEESSANYGPSPSSSSVRRQRHSLSSEASSAAYSPAAVLIASSALDSSRLSNVSAISRRSSNSTKSPKQQNKSDNWITVGSIASAALSPADTAAATVAPSSHSVGGAAAAGKKKASKKLNKSGANSSKNRFLDLTVDSIGSIAATSPSLSSASRSPRRLSSASSIGGRRSSTGVGVSEEASAASISFSNSGDVSRTSIGESSSMSMNAIDADVSVASAAQSPKSRRTTADSTDIRAFIGEFQSSISNTSPGASLEASIDAPPVEASVDASISGDAHAAPEPESILSYSTSSSTVFVQSAVKASPAGPAVVEQQQQQQKEINNCSQQQEEDDNDDNDNDEQQEGKIGNSLEEQNASSVSIIADTSVVAASAANAFPSPSVMDTSNSSPAAASVPAAPSVPASGSKINNNSSRYSISSVVLGDATTTSYSSATVGNDISILSTGATNESTDEPYSQRRETADPNEMAAIMKALEDEEEEARHLVQGQSDSQESRRETADPLELEMLLQQMQKDEESESLHRSQRGNARNSSVSSVGRVSTASSTVSSRRSSKASSTANRTNQEAASSLALDSSTLSTSSVSSAVSKKSTRSNKSSASAKSKIVSSNNSRSANSSAMLNVSASDAPVSTNNDSSLISITSAASSSSSAASLAPRKEHRETADVADLEAFAKELLAEQHMEEEEEEEQSAQFSSVSSVAPTSVNASRLSISSRRQSGSRSADLSTSDLIEFSVLNTSSSVRASVSASPTANDKNNNRETADASDLAFFAAELAAAQQTDNSRLSDINTTTASSISFTAGRGGTTGTTNNRDTADSVDLAFFAAQLAEEAAAAAAQGQVQAQVIEEQDNSSLSVLDKSAVSSTGSRSTRSTRSAKTAAVKALSSSAASSPAAAAPSLRRSPRRASSRTSSAASSAVASPATVSGDLSNMSMNSVNTVGTVDLLNEVEEALIQASQSTMHNSQAANASTVAGTASSNKNNGDDDDDGDMHNESDMSNASLSSLGGIFNRMNKEREEALTGLAAGDDSTVGADAAAAAPMAGIASSNEIVDASIEDLTAYITPADPIEEQGLDTGSSVTNSAAVAANNNSRRKSTSDATLFSPSGGGLFSPAAKKSGGAKKGTKNKKNPPRHSIAPLPSAAPFAAPAPVIATNNNNRMRDATSEEQQVDNILPVLNEIAQNVVHINNNKAASSSSVAAMLPPMPGSALKARSNYSMAGPVSASAKKIVVFGSPQVAEFNKSSPTTNYTPLQRSEAKKLFAMNSGSSAEQSRVESDDITMENERILMEWERLANMSNDGSGADGSGDYSTEPENDDAAGSNDISGFNSGDTPRSSAGAADVSRDCNSISSTPPSASNRKKLSSAPSSADAHSSSKKNRRRLSGRMPNLSNQLESSSSDEEQQQQQEDEEDAYFVLETSIAASSPGSPLARGAVAAAAAPAVVVPGVDLSTTSGANSSRGDVTETVCLPKNLSELMAQNDPGNIGREAVFGETANALMTDAANTSHGSVGSSCASSSYDHTQEIEGDLQTLMKRYGAGVAEQEQQQQQQKKKSSKKRGRVSRGGAQEEEEEQSRYGGSANSSPASGMSSGSGASTGSDSSNQIMPLLQKRPLGPGTPDASLIWDAAPPQDEDSGDLLDRSATVGLEGNLGDILSSYAPPKKRNSSLGASVADDSSLQLEQEVSVDSVDAVAARVGGRRHSMATTTAGAVVTKNKNPFARRKSMSAVMPSASVHSMLQNSSDGNDYSTSSSGASEQQQQVSVAGAEEEEEQEYSTGEISVIQRRGSVADMYGTNGGSGADAGEDVQFSGDEGEENEEEGENSVLSSAHKLPLARADEEVLSRSVTADQNYSMDDLRAAAAAATAVTHANIASSVASGQTINPMALLGKLKALNADAKSNLLCQASTPVTVQGRSKQMSQQLKRRTLDMLNGQLPQSAQKGGLAVGGHTVYANATSVNMELFADSAKKSRPSMAAGGRPSILLASPEPFMAASTAVARASVGGSAGSSRRNSMAKQPTSVIKQGANNSVVIYNTADLLLDNSGVSSNATTIAEDDKDDDDDDEAATIPNTSSSVSITSSSSSAKAASVVRRHSEANAFASQFEDDSLMDGSTIFIDPNFLRDTAAASGTGAGTVSELSPAQVEELKYRLDSYFSVVSTFRISILNFSETVQRMVKEVLKNTFRTSHLETNLFNIPPEYLEGAWDMALTDGDSFTSDLMELFLNSSDLNCSRERLFESLAYSTVNEWEQFWVNLGSMALLQCVEAFQLVGQQSSSCSTAAASAKVECFEEETSLDAFFSKALSSSSSSSSSVVVGGTVADKVAAKVQNASLLMSVTKKSRTAAISVANTPSTQQKQQQQQHLVPSSAAKSGLETSVILSSAVENGEDNNNISAAPFLHSLFCKTEALREQQKAVAEQTLLTGVVNRISHVRVAAYNSQTVGVTVNLSSRVQVAVDFNLEHATSGAGRLVVKGVDCDMKILEPPVSADNGAGSKKRRSSGRRKSLSPQEQQEELEIQFVQAYFASVLSNDAQGGCLSPTVLAAVHSPQQIPGLLKQISCAVCTLRLALAQLAHLQTDGSHCTVFKGFSASARSSAVQFQVRCERYEADSQQNKKKKKIRGTRQGRRSSRGSSATSANSSFASEEGEEVLEEDSVSSASSVAHKLHSPDGLSIGCFVMSVLQNQSLLPTF